MNTLEIVKILEEKDFSHDNAIKLAEAINGKSGLATKEDIFEVTAELKSDISEVKAELKNDIFEVKAELKNDISEVKRDVQWLKWLMGIGMSLVIAGMLFLFARMEGVETRLNEKIDHNYKELSEKIDGLKDLIIQEMRK